ncbi:hypothetical protein LWM68_07310 [Niabella sp. W65]|nr:hypothetical protein [Niabella sp. W65]MCH7362599.1 hypothetical protein [Niabella sp. W65]ULT38550.1 hypothetical protein KRR40_25955 [Niabella sp. I65]
MITGDSDKEAWKEHITDYHKESLPSHVLSASHHGSRTFFKENEEDKDIYEAHIKEINPTYLIISAPKQEDSPHGHPHDDAMELYKKHVEEENIFHLGKNYESVIVDIDSDGNMELTFDKELVEEYGQGRMGMGTMVIKPKIIALFTLGPKHLKLITDPTDNNAMV